MMSHPCSTQDQDRMYSIREEGWASYGRCFHIVQPDREQGEKGNDKAH
jgi:hypothetical protein